MPKSRVGEIIEDYDHEDSFNRSFHIPGPPPASNLSAPGSGSVIRRRAFQACSTAVTSKMLIQRRLSGEGTLEGTLEGLMGALPAAPKRQTISVFPVQPELPAAAPSPPAVNPVLRGLRSSLQESYPDVTEVVPEPQQPPPAVRPKSLMDPYRRLPRLPGQSVSAVPSPMAPVAASPRKIHGTTFSLPPPPSPLFTVHATPVLPQSVSQLSSTESFESAPPPPPPKSPRTIGFRSVSLPTEVFPQPQPESLVSSTSLERTSSEPSRLITLHSPSTDTLSVSSRSTLTLESPPSDSEPVLSDQADSDSTPITSPSPEMPSSATNLNLNAAPRNTAAFRDMSAPIGSKEYVYRSHSRSKSTPSRLPPSETDLSDGTASFLTANSTVSAFTKSSDSLLSFINSYSGNWDEDGVLDTYNEDSPEENETLKPEENPLRGSVSSASTVDFYQYYNEDSNNNKTDASSYRTTGASSYKTAAAVQIQFLEKPLPRIPPPVGILKDSTKRKPEKRKSRFSMLLPRRSLLRRKSKSKKRVRILTPTSASLRRVSGTNSDDEDREFGEDSDYETPATSPEQSPTRHPVRCYSENLHGPDLNQSLDQSLGQSLVYLKRVSIDPLMLNGYQNGSKRSFSESYVH